MHETALYPPFKLIVIGCLIFFVRSSFVFCFFTVCDCIIQSNLDYKLLMLHVCSIFVWIMIKMQWLPLILNGKSTDKALFCLYEEISVICYLFI